MRNYQHEAAIEKPERKAERAARNRARLKVRKATGSASIAGKDIHHTTGKVTENPKLSDLKAVAPAVHNHGRAGAQGGKLKKR